MAEPVGPPRRRPEVLAPAGGHPQLQAAIENGADAVYFGLTEWNARARAANFAPEELPDILANLHERGVAGFVALNTLIFDEEGPAAVALVEQIARAGADAVIVQDLGLVRRIHELVPELPIHGSTQMTVTSPEGVELVAALGVQRVVLARELSVAEIRTVAARAPIEVEAFVHGALCVSYSGQCFSSEAWGGRSANRGQCAQACRLPYDLLVDGEHRPLADVRYLLSPQDLMGVDHVAALVDAGVACLKIEGRLKGPEYVALTTRTYRRAVDAAWSGAPVEVGEAERRDLAQVFSRGQSPGFLDGVRHQRLVHGRFPRHRGLMIGRVRAVAPSEFEVELQGPVETGDGVVFDGGRPQEDEAGGTIVQVLHQGRPLARPIDRGRVTLAFGPRSDVRRAQVGDRVWRTRSPRLEQELRETWIRPTRKVPVDARVGGIPGRPLRLELRDDDGHAGVAESKLTLVPARERALDETVLRATLGRLGTTSLELRNLDLALPESVFLPVSELNQLRRVAAAALVAGRRAVPTRPCPPEPASPNRPVSRESALSAPSLSVLCRTPEQVEAACAIPWLNEVIVDFLEVKGLGQAVTRIQAVGKRAIAASPRVLKPDEQRIRNFLLKLGADALLVRSLGLLRSLADSIPRPELHGDFSLNATNQWTVALLFEHGLTRLAPGHDLNLRQLAALPAGDGRGLELVVHHHLPIFHTEHCVFARFLSGGNGPEDCGRPCERHTVHLRGDDGKSHLVQADIGCRNTVFNHEAQSASRHLGALVDAGWRRFRVELADHPPQEVRPLLNAYREGLFHGSPAQQTWARVRDASRFGLTLGSLRVIDEPGAEARKVPGWSVRPGS